MSLRSHRVLPPLLVFLIIGGMFLYTVFTHEVHDEKLILPSGQERIVVKDTPLIVEMATTSLDRERGLSGRARLTDTDGMLFVFENDDRHGFWMLDMRFALDLVFIDSKGVIAYIVPHATPESYPHVFTPPSPIRSVLEVPSGYAQKYGWTAGDRVVVGP